MKNQRKTKLSPQAIRILGYQLSEDFQPRDLEKDLFWLKYHGLTPLPDYVTSFLQKYSGVQFAAIGDHYRSRMEVSFGLLEAGESGGLKEITEDAKVLLGQTFYPIGAMYEIELEQPLCRDKLILLLAEDGSIYSYYSHTLQKQGVDVNDFINRIVADRPIAKETCDRTINYSARDPNLQALKKKRKREQKLKRRQKD
jgi:hypothetical protein